MTFRNDDSVSDDTLLLRRIPSRPKLTIIWDSNLGCWRPSSAAFEDHKNGSPMSIVLEDTLIELGRALDSALTGHETGFSLAAITAGTARENNQGVARDPVDDEPAHGVVFGRKTKKTSRNLARSSTWIVEPDLAEP